MVVAPFAALSLRSGVWKAYERREIMGTTPPPSFEVPRVDNRFVVCTFVEWEEKKIGEVDIIIK